MPYQLPHKGDRLSAHDQRRMVDQLRRDDAVTVYGMPDLYRPGQAFIAQIEDVTESGGHVFYDWQTLAVTYSATGEATYTELGILGNNEDWPYLIDIGHEENDPPTFAIGDRVVVNVIDGHEGLAYVINSKIIGSEVTPVEVDKQYEVSAADTVTVDARDWRGRVIWYTVMVSTNEVGAGEQDTDYADGMTAVGAHYSGILPTGSTEIDIYNYDAAGQTIQFYLDDTANGELKCEFGGASIANGLHVRITCKGFPQMAEADYIDVS